MNKKEKLLMFRMLRLIWNKINKTEKIDFWLNRDLEKKIKELEK